MNAKLANTIIRRIKEDGRYEALGRRSGMEKGTWMVGVYTHPGFVWIRKPQDWTDLATYGTNGSGLNTQICRPA